jgi:3-oxoacyl-[acyl-carrier-protein] synthase-3
MPPNVLSNHDLEQLVDTSDEWITTRTGIKERRISHVETSDMAAVAGQHALAAAGKRPEDVDLLLVATCTPDSIIPSTASIVQNKIGADQCAAMDINAACSGFLYGLVLGANMIRSGGHKTVLVIGAEKLHYVLDFTDRTTCVLFGDGAGAVVLESCWRPPTSRTGFSPPIWVSTVPSITSCRPRSTAPWVTGAIRIRRSAVSPWRARRCFGGR